MSTYPKHPIPAAEMYEIHGKPFRTLDKENPTLIDRAVMPCPACDGQLAIALTMGTYHGKPRTKLAYLQCKAWPSDPGHGYGPKSPHVDASYKGDTSVTPPIDPKPSAAPKAATGLAGIGALVEAAIEETVGSRVSALEADLRALANNPGIDLETVRETVKEMLAAQPPRVIEMVGPELRVRLGGIVHPVLPQMVERYHAGQRNFMLVGPAGTGKTTIALKFAEAIKATRRTLIACSEDMRREAIVGFKAYNVQTGETPYKPSAVVEDIIHSDGPSVTIFEEVDAANPNVLLTLNALENGLLPTPDDTQDPDKRRNTAHAMVCTANTFGTAGSNVYVGRNQLDAATLDRYVTIFVDYDDTVERHVVGDDKIVDLIRAAREKLNAAGLRKVLSTRVARQIAQDKALSFNKGKSDVQVTREVLKCKGWSDVELGRVL